MRQGRRLSPAASLAGIRESCSRELRSLPPDVRPLAEGPTSYPVRVSEEILRLVAELDARTH